MSKVPQNTNHEEINLKAEKGSFKRDKKVTNFLNGCLPWTERRKMSEHFLSLFFFFSLKEKVALKPERRVEKKKKREKEKAYSFLLVAVQSNNPFKKFVTFLSFLKKSFLASKISLWFVLLRR